MTVALVVIALTVQAGRQLGSLHDRQEAQDRNQDALKTATLVVESLTSLSAGAESRLLTQITANSTGAFGEELKRRASSYEKELRSSDVEADGDVVEAGIAQATEDRAVVLLAVTAKVKNRATPHGERRHYRMRVTLDRADDRWLVSNLELVA